MKLITICEVTGEKENTYINYNGNLMDILPLKEIDMLHVDGRIVNLNEKEFQIDNSAKVTLHIKPPQGAVVGFVISALISMVISTVLSKITQALFGKKAKKPRLAQADQREDSPTYAFEGIRDTIAAGEPIPFILGKVRKGGQIISTRVELFEDGKRQRLYFMLCLGHGQISMVEDIELNGTKITAFQGATFDWRAGSAGGNTLMTGFENTVDQTYFDGRDFTDADIIYTTKTEVDQVDLFISALQGIFHNTDQGDFLSNRSHCDISYRPQTSAGEPWILAKASHRVQGRTTNQKHTIYQLAFPSKDTYEIKLHWTVAYYTDANQSSWRLSLYNVVERVYESRTYDGYALLGITAISTAQLTGSLPTVTAIVKGMVRDVSDILSYSRNPAWCIREILRNTVWGLGHRLPDTYFETITWQNFADYCDEVVDGFGGSADPIVRHELSYVGDTKSKGWDLVQDLLSIYDASIIFSEGKLKVVIDREQSATQLYSEANMVRGSLSVTFARAERKMNTINAKYYNEGEDYKLDFVKVQDTDALLTESEKAEDLDLIGVTRQSEAIYVASRHLKENIYRKKEYSWKSPFGAIVAEPGDRVKLQYYVSDFERGASGYVLAGNTTEIYLDKTVVIAAGKTYEIFIRHKNQNTFVQEDIVTGAGTWGKVVVVSPLVSAVTEGDLWAIGEKDIALADVLLERVIQQTDGSFELSGSNYDTNIYTTDALPAQINRNRSAIGNIMPLPIESWTVRESTEILPDGSVGSFLEFDIMPGMLKNSGKSLGATASTIDLSANEPSGNNFFINAKITITNGTGTGQSRTILAYDGLLKRVTQLNSNWSTAPDTTSEYEIDFVRAGEYFGSIVEFSEDQEDWFELGRIIGVAGNLPVRGQGKTVYLRLTPFTVADKRNENALLIQSITTSGKDEVPSNVSNFSVVQVNDVLLFTWTNITDLDIDYYEIRSGNSWLQSMRVGESKQNFFETTEFTAGEKTYWIKAFDRTGNESDIAASYDVELEVPNSRLVYSTTDELSLLNGVFDGTASRDLGTSYGNGLGLSAQYLWDNGLSWDTALSGVSASQAIEVWDGTTVLTGTYVTPVYDIGAIAYARIFADIGFQDSQGVTLTIEEQHSDDGVTYSPWRLIGAGDQKWRYARLRITISVGNSSDDPVINKFDVVIDAKVRVYRGIGVTVPATSAGLSVTFSTSYIQTPNIVVMEHNRAPVVYLSSPSKSGFTIVHDEVSASTVDWRSEGI